MNVLDTKYLTLLKASSFVSLVVVVSMVTQSSTCILREPGRGYEFENKIVGGVVS